MASFKQYTASGGASEAFSIPSFTSDEIKVRVDGVLKTAATHYNITSYTTNGGTVTWTSGNVPSSGTVYIYRDTKILNSGNSDVEAKSTYSNGSVIYHGDLNRNQLQVLRAIEEENDQKIQSWELDTGIVESSTIKDGTIVNIDVNDNAAIAQSKLNIANATTSASGYMSNSDKSKLDGIEAGATADQTLNELSTLGVATKTGTDTLTNKTLTSPVINDMSGTAVVTSGTSTSDTKTYSAKRAGEIFYGKDTLNEIQSGETWSAADDKIATTSAIDARIIDLIDDVGGFVPIANETSFPNANPDVNNGAGTLVSIKALASNLTSNGSGVATIANGTVGNSTVTINGLENSTTYAATLGMIVETTSTLNTYTFHRVTPKATEVTTVAGSITNVNTVATNISNINDFSDKYRVASSAPTSSLDVGDLYFDTTGNELKVYNGSSWQAGVTATGGFVSKSGDQLTGNLTFSGSQTVDGRDLSVDGTKLDGIAASANNYSISSDLLDEDDMSTDSATKVPSQQSVKAFSSNASNLASGTVGTARLGSGTASNSNFLRGAGTWASPANTQVSIDDTPVDGVTNEAISSNWAYDHNASTGNGAHVPAAGSAGQFLKHDGTWGTPPDTDTTYTFGKSSGNALKSEEALTTDDVLLMGTSHVKGRTYAELKTDLSLNNVENTALSTWAGSSNITTVGTLTGATIDGSYKQVAEAVGALDIDLSTGNYFTKTISADSTFTFSNPASSGTVSAFTIELTHTSGTVTWPTEVKFNGDSAPTLATGKTHLFMFVTDDGGSRYRAAALIDYVN